MAMRDFIDGLEEATAALEDFAAAAGAAGGGSGARANYGAGAAAGGGSSGRGSQAEDLSRGLLKTFAALGGAGAVGRLGTAGVEGFMADGAGGAMGSINQAGISALRNVPYVGELISTGLGLTQQQTVAQRTTGAVSADLGEFAKYGIDIPDDILNQQIGIRAEQQGRVYELEKKIAARTAQDRNVTRGENESSGRSDMTAFEKLATAIDRLSDWLDNAPLIGGGSNR